MGASSSRFSNTTISEEEIHLMLLGLDAGGMTTFLYRLQLGETVKTVPTIGFNVESITYRNQPFTIWDYGGTNKMRVRWRTYFKDVRAMIFFVDSTESNRFGDAADQLACYLDMEVLRHAILLVVCNKQDKKGARGIQEMSDALRLGSIQGRNWSIVKCCALDDGEIGKVMDTLMDGLSITERKE